MYSLTPYPNPNITTKCLTLALAQPNSTLFLTMKPSLKPQNFLWSCEEWLKFPNRPDVIIVFIQNVFTHIDKHTHSHTHTE